MAGGGCNGCDQRANLRLWWSRRQPIREPALIRSIAGHLADFAADVAGALCTHGRREWHSAVRLRRPELRQSRSAECFDTWTNTWSSLPTIRRARCRAGVAVSRGHVYLVGGTGESDESSSERLPPKGNWQTLPDMNVGKSMFSTAVVTSITSVVVLVNLQWNRSTLTWAFGNHWSR